MEQTPFTPRTAAGAEPHLVLKIAQWVVAAFLIYICVRSVIEIGEAKAVSFTVWLSLAFVALAAVLHMPPVFFRASLKARYGIYAVATIALLVLGFHEHQFKPTGTGAGWSGANEGPAYAGVPKPLACDEVVAEVVGMSKGTSNEIIEVNNVETVSVATADRVKCTGDAITRSGEKSISFGVETSPQGKAIVSAEFK
ncbi:MAG: hypothetical protein EOO82_00580 [Oxalobacteraceae bacterium]|nr:MAG: hypothetical protein EOO82_00580 [Oxalobacteraceae bacterium]